MSYQSSVTTAMIFLFITILAVNIVEITSEQDDTIVSSSTEETISEQDDTSVSSSTEETIAVLTITTPLNILLIISLDNVLLRTIL